MFHLAAGKRRALEDGPWMLSNEALIMADFDGSKTLDEINLSYTLIWIRVLKLPLGMINKASGEAIGAEIGEFVEVDLSDDNMANGCFLRVKVKLDIRKLLLRGLTIVTGEEGKERWCPLMYEFLPDFSYVYGIIGHTNKVCATKLGKEEVAQF